MINFRNSYDTEVDKLQPPTAVKTKEDNAVMANISTTAIKPNDVDFEVDLEDISDEDSEREEDFITDVNFELFANEKQHDSKSRYITIKL